MSLIGLFAVLALGATPRGILGSVVRHGLMVTITGVVIGVAGALLLARLISNLIVGVGRSDPLTYAGVIALLTIVALIASAIPARRAARIDPAISLRNE